MSTESLRESVGRVFGRVSDRETLDEGRKSRTETTGKLRSSALEMVRVAEGWAAVRNRSRDLGVVEDEGEKTAAQAIGTFLSETRAYRKKLLEHLDVIDGLALPGRDQSKESLVSAMEAADQLLEDLSDTVLSDFGPMLKKLGVPTR